MIHRLAIPTPFLVGRVNCWLIEDDPLTLIDTGPNSGKALDELERGLAEHGHKVEDLERIVISHQHIDHLGLAEILARRSGAEVCAWEHLAPYLADYPAQAEADDATAQQFMLRHGIGADVVTALRSVSGSFRAWGARVQVTRTLKEGDTLEFADRTLHVHHRPGHSPSDLVFHDAERGVLLGADHLLAHISSNPLISRPLDRDLEPGERPRALHTYMASLRATRAMELEVVLPGHGENVTNHRELIDQRFTMHERRADRIGRTIAEHGRMSAHEVAQTIWGNVAVTQAFLTLSEVLGHVDLLVERGDVQEIDEDGHTLLEPA